MVGLLWHVFDLFQLRFNWGFGQVVNRVWTNGLQSVKPNSLMISNCLLRYSNFSLIQAIAWHCYCNHSLFIEHTKRKPFWFWLTPFLSYLLIIYWWDWLFVPRSMCKNNTMLPTFSHHSPVWSFLKEFEAWVDHSSVILTLHVGHSQYYY